ncbi:hypothetical protein ACFW6E_15145 [Streptomyces olivaceoviridis]|uniref:hypothetical protein n=1 Tax=Streptomyces olivaceoviridis TaxID=1921 RepID=UPI0036C28313
MVRVDEDAADELRFGVPRRTRADPLVRGAPYLSASRPVGACGSRSPGRYAQASPGAEPGRQVVDGRLREFYGGR